MSLFGDSFNDKSSLIHNEDGSTGIFRVMRRCVGKCKREKVLLPRTVHIRKSEVNVEKRKFPPNAIRNRKYNIFTFFPIVLFEQFKFFLNLYFLCMACTQFIPALRIGYWYTYWGPLAFVIFVTMVREAVDDVRRYRRDLELNSEQYQRLELSSLGEDESVSRHTMVASSELRVGDIIRVEKNQRIPADLVLLRTSEASGTCFLRTDQLDGETDWKLRIALPTTQSLSLDEDLLELEGEIYAEKPSKSIHRFLGRFTTPGSPQVALGIDHTLWGSTVLASGVATGIVVYTGVETRSVMNTEKARSKVGLLDLEVNRLTKILFLGVCCLSFIMLSIKGFGGPWYQYLIRFFLLFSYIIPLSLRVMLDMGKIVHSWFIQRDPDLKGTVVRSTTIPEELGRVQYLMSDKTGTLTQNHMIFRKIHLGSISYTVDTMDEVSTAVKLVLGGRDIESGITRHSAAEKVTEAVLACALCHNVTPVTDTQDSSKEGTTYQASSPDEIALVEWTTSVGVSLVFRDLSRIGLRFPDSSIHYFSIHIVFPFTSESKRMGAVLENEQTGEIFFFLKGADTVMARVVAYSDWLEEEVGNLAREGLRTLVVARKRLTREAFVDLQERYHNASLAVSDRAEKAQRVQESLERDLELLCVTGVEDLLQETVKPTLETLRNAGIKLWMLTGDKLETAVCIAQSARLVERGHGLHVIPDNVNDRAGILHEFNQLRRRSSDRLALVLTGDVLKLCLEFYKKEFAEIACECPAVVVCRCSPTQKADVVTLLQSHTGKRVCAIGDGGNDVSMIQMADCGIGVEGKEGKQASLAADFSIPKFAFLSRLLLVHGRYSYKRSAGLSQFIIHRGLIISTMQAVFSSLLYFASVPLFPGFLMIGYATFYTTFPVFSLILDQDISPQTALTYPELYRELTKGRSLNFKTFCTWVLISIFQGGVLMYGSLLLYVEDLVHIVDIAFTALLLTEMLMVALTVRTWHWFMPCSMVFGTSLYILTVLVMKDYFDATFLISKDFVWRVIVLTALSCIPLYIVKFLRRRFSPTTYSKLQN